MAGTGTSDPLNPFVDIVRKRIDEGWSSRSAFAAESGLDDGGLSKILARKVDATDDTILKIGAALKLSDLEILAMAHMIEVPAGASDETGDMARYRHLVRSLTPGEKEALLDVMELLAIRFVEQRTGARPASGEPDAPNEAGRRRRRGAKPA